LIANIRCESALRIKKYFNEFFLPKFYRSINITDKRKLGVYPKTVNVYDENDLLVFPNMNGKITNCPK
jgi:hypothetical protein